MQCKGVQPVHVTFVGLLNACAIVAALEEGRKAHKQIMMVMSLMYLWVIDLLTCTPNVGA
jgi:hypothetical protein